MKKQKSSKPNWIPPDPASPAPEFGVGWRWYDETRILRLMFQIDDMNPKYGVPIALNLPCEQRPTYNEAELLVGHYVLYGISLSPYQKFRAIMPMVWGDFVKCAGENQTKPPTTAMRDAAYQL